MRILGVYYLLLVIHMFPMNLVGNLFRMFFPAVNPIVVLILVFSMNVIGKVFLFLIPAVVPILVLIVLMFPFVFLKLVLNEMVPTLRLMDPLSQTYPLNYVRVHSSP